MYGKGFLGNITENLQADCVQSRQAGFIQCFLYAVFPQSYKGNTAQSLCGIAQEKPRLLANQLK